MLYRIQRSCRIYNFTYGNCSPNSEIKWHVCMAHAVYAAMCGRMLSVFFSRPCSDFRVCVWICVQKSVDVVML